MSAQNLVAAEVLASVDKHAVGPWIQPLTDAFKSTNGKIERRVPCGLGLVDCVALSNDDKFVYSGSQEMALWTSTT